jgi:hypothetical protein
MFEQLPLRARLLDENADDMLAAHAACRSPLIGLRRTHAGA